jgi:hypothetical protein
MRDMFHFFLVFTYFQKIFVVYIMMPYELWLDFLFCFVLLKWLRWLNFPLENFCTLASSELVPGIFNSVCSRGCSSLAFLLDLNLGPGSLLVGLIICQVSSYQSAPSRTKKIKFILILGNDQQPWLT